MMITEQERKEEKKFLERCFRDPFHYYGECKKLYSNWEELPESEKVQIAAGIKNGLTKEQTDTYTGKGLDRGQMIEIRMMLEAGHSIEQAEEIASHKDWAPGKMWKVIRTLPGCKYGQN